MFAELTCRSSMNRTKITSLLRYENHICWTADINKFLKKFRCYICDQFFDRSFNLLRHMQNCSKFTQQKYPTGAYQLFETVFERLEDVNINIPQELRLFSHLIVFDFESITVPDNTLRKTELTSWLGKHVPISVSISSNLLSEPILICNEDPLQLIRDFVSGLTYIAEKSTLLEWGKSSMISCWNWKKKTGQFDNWFQWKTSRYPPERKTYLITRRNLTERKTKTLKFRNWTRFWELLHHNSCVWVKQFEVRFELNRGVSSTHLLIEKNVVHKVIRMGNQYNGMNFLGLQFLDILNFLGGATTLDNFLKPMERVKKKILHLWRVRQYWEVKCITTLTNRQLLEQVEEPKCSFGRVR